MGYSEDEDDFLSADEDVESNDIKQGDDDKKSQRHIVKSRVSDSAMMITNTETKSTIAEYDKDGDRMDEIVSSTHEKESEKSQLREPQAKSVSQTKALGRNKEEARSNYDNNDDDDDEKEGEEEDVEDEDDDEEEALAERIRERNLKIARNFSVEIARNLKASAPIPVKTSNSSSRCENSEYPDNTLDTSHNKSANLPPAPPPTPALSSSYNNLNDSANQSASGPSLSLGTQYSWRLPQKTTSSATAPATTTPTVGNEQNSCNKSTSPSSATNTGTAEQARLALDRLSEKLSKPNKNLFGQVTDDIKNMSIKGDDSLIVADVTSQISATLPASITDLGSTIGSWGWSGATSLLSSATQVTSQVGSVLQQLQPTYQLQEENNTKGKKNVKDD